MTPDAKDTATKVPWSQMRDPRKAKVSVADVIEWLRQLPPDMAVFYNWDESGEYWPVRLLPGRVCRVSYKRRPWHKGKRWEQENDTRGQRVLCLDQYRDAETVLWACRKRKTYKRATPAKSRRMTNLRGEVHTECPDCRGEACEPVEPANPAAGAGPAADVE